MSAPTSEAEGFFIEESEDALFRLGMRNSRGRGPSLIEIFEDDGDLRFFVDEFEGDVRVPIEMLPGIRQALAKIAANQSAPLSIAEDLRAPQPGSFEGATLVSTVANLPGAMVILGDGSIVKPSETPIGRAAAREALAILRDRLQSLPSFGERVATLAVLNALDRLAEGFR